ncbi:MAG: dihydrolipoyl dehydrogenase [Gemmatales bacterium]|nr:dihydrolipoyl dehydrogenase [Gemmatales bacterium]MDW8387326.1 dihydrolipoyl dehydrogenase [Gemmatales bacterium]
MAETPSTEKAELVVLGGGPGGYAAAFHAADLGLKPVLVEQEKRLGGVCLLRGCIPSKALITAAEFYERIRHADQMGIVVQGVSLDMPRVGAWRDKIIADLAGGLDLLCKQRGIRRVVGRGVFRSPRELEISGPEGSRVLAFEKIVIAVGSSTSLPALFPKSDRVVTSDEALFLDRVPRTMLVVGGGYIGVELGSCYAAFGSQVVIVELLDRLLSGTDADLVRVLRQRLDQRGVEVHLESRVVAATETADGVEVEVQPREGPSWKRTFDTVLLAVGRKPNTANLGLDKIGVETDPAGHIRVNSRLQTNLPHVFAIGDCTGQPYLAHRAKQQGIVAAEVIAGKPAEFDNRTVPAVIFGDPEIAYCGLSEEEAKKAGYRVKVGRFRFAANGRARTLGQTDGLINVIAEEGTETILGVRMVGPLVSELLGEATLAVETGAVVEDLVGTIHAHPTLSEALQEAAEAVRGHALHAARSAPRSR